MTVDRRRTAENRGDWGNVGAFAERVQQALYARRLSKLNLPQQTRRPRVQKLIARQPNSLDRETVAAWRLYIEEDQP